MRLRALLVPAIVLVFMTTAAHAGGVDWSDYVEKPGDRRKLVNISPQWSAPPAKAKDAKTAKKAKPDRVARPAKAKANKSKAKTRGKKAKRRR